MCMRNRSGNCCHGCPLIELAMVKHKHGNPYRWDWLLHKYQTYYCTNLYMLDLLHYHLTTD